MDATHSLSSQSNLQPELPSMSPISFESLESRRLMAFFGHAIKIPDLVFKQVQPFVISGTEGNDFITVNYSNNALMGPRVTYQVNGQPAVVAFPSAGQPIQIHGLGGNDTIRSTGSGVEMYGQEGNDKLIGGPGADFMYGQNGLDTIVASGGADYQSGGNGADTMDYSARTTALSITVDLLSNDGAANEKDYVSGDFEHVLCGSGNDFVNLVPALVTSRRVVGGAGNDQLYGHDGPDILMGGYGNDTCYGYGGDDYIIGEAGNDLVRGYFGRDLVSGGYGNDVVYGDAGMDTVYGDQGNDRLYGGADADQMYGGDNDDILVAIGGTQADVLRGDGGFDSFWCDSEASEKVMDLSIAESFMNIHRISGFMPLKVAGQYKQTPNRELDMPAIVDPLLEGNYEYRTFFGTRLFGPNGPRPDDVDQNDLGDCYFMAPLAALAKTNPNLIKQLVVDLGDGTFAVNFQKNNVDSWVRVDSHLPVYPGTNTPAFAGLGKQSSMWVPIMEKAYAFFRSDFGSYFSVGNGGQPTEPMYHMGVSNRVYNPTVPQEMVNVISQMLNLGKPVMVGTKGGITNLVERHVYMVESVTWSGTDYQIKLRNPWGEDGPGADSVNDGIVTVTGTALFNRMHATHGITFGT
jgi:Ca2+-binding RTX toxin-like protein